MKKILFLFLLVVVFFVSKGVKANNDPYEDHSNGYKINYISQTSVNLKWDTNCPTNENFYYKAEGSNQENQRAANCYEKPFSSDRECQMVLSNLDSMTRYYFSNRCGNQNYNFENYFVTLRKLDDSSVEVVNISHDSVTIKWRTNIPYRSKIFYFPENNTYNQNTILKNATSMFHEMTLTGLIPNTKYKYKVTSSISGGGVISDYLDFTTLAELPTQKADLVPSGISIRDGNNKLKTLGRDPIAGEKFYISISYKNIGEVKTNNTPFRINVYINDIFEKQLTAQNNDYLVDLGGNMGVDEMLELSLPAGLHTIKYVLDVDNQIEESNTNNNTYTTTINIKVEEHLNEIEKINKRSEDLLHGRIDNLLSEINELRNQVREQQTQIRYLEGLTQELSRVSSEMRSAINTFITYGVDDNTRRLGEGERAAVINSFKAAYGNLPNSEKELSDVIKIANGRWPSQINIAAENRAKEEFKNIYKREANMNNPHDNAAVTIMAYGLRQKAENRNLNSEAAGLRTFRNIYNRLPQSTEDWNILQAITYSGASR